jgi:non-ribosomal peptide synthetase component E (peptide arylation enzyme)
MVYVQLPSSVELFLLRLACERAGLRLLTVPPAFREAEIAPILEAVAPAIAVVPRRYRGVDHVALLRALPAAPCPAASAQRPAASAQRPAASAQRPGASSPRLVTVRRWGGGDEPTLDRLAEAGAPAVPSERAFTASEPCQLGTTSGSTGAPKLVDVTIGARLCTGRVQAERYGLCEEDVVLALTPIITGTADALGYHGCPQIGTTLALAEHFEPGPACRLVAEHRATVVIGVPTMAARMLAAPEIAEIERGQVRVFVSHAAQLPPSLGRALEERLGCRVMQAYGTFDYGGVSATRFDDPEEVRLTTVGTALDGNELVVLDEAGRPCAPGEPGRLHVRGAHANAGYFGREDLTRAAWASGWFDLAEIGVRDERGQVRLLGRARDLIIRGGQNIVPADLEEMLARHPDVAEVAVIGLPEPELGEIACACVVARDGASLAAEGLLAFVRGLGVAAFKLPGRIELFDALPILGTGHKVDRRRLRELVLARARVGRGGYGGGGGP